MERTVPALELLRPVAQSANDERDAQDKEAVRQDRADQGRLDDDDEAGLQREDRDEQLRQVSETRLKDPGHGR